MERSLWNSQPDTCARNASPLRGWRLFLTALAVCLACSAGAANFTASLDHDTITLGDNATLSLRFEDGGQAEAPTLPEIPGLQTAYVGPSSQFSFVNGRTSSSVTHNYTVTPQQAGDFTIPAFSVEIGGQKFTSEPLRLTVLKPGAPPPAAINSGNQIAFLKLVVPNQQMYVGETEIMEMDLYLHQGVRGASGFDLSALPADGLSVGKMVQGEERQVQVGGANYQRVPLYFPITAVKAGTIQVGPANVSIVLQIANNNQGFDPFGMFGTEQRKVILATDSQTIQSMQLPSENVPPGFNGAVGEYQMAVSAGPTNVAAGDPVTLRVQISGHGSLDTITLPEQPTWHNFKTYPPTSKVDASGQFGLDGTKTFEQIVTPENTDVHELPPVSFSYFNPKDHTYHVLEQPALPLTVRPGGETVVPASVAGNPSRAETPASDILPIKQHLGSVALVNTPLVTQTWFVAFQSVPALAFVGAFLWRKRTDSLANNPRLRRRRLVAQILRDGRADLERFAAGNHSEEFFATLFRLLQEQLGERLDCPASAITESIVDEQLARRALPETALADLRELFQTCNVARYAPSRSSQELSKVILRFDNAVKELQNLKS